jgi:DHA2 family multidrug resistance protein
VDNHGKVGYAGYTEAARWIVLVGLMLGTVLEMLDVSIVNVAIPSMMGNLGATLDQVNWVSTGYIIANVVVLPLSGWLSVYYGRRKYLTGSILLFTSASFMCGMSRSLNMLIFWRIVQGAGGAALLSTAMATLLDIFPEERHGLVAAIFGIGVMTGPTIGPVLGGFITDNYSWPWIFFINLPIGLPAAYLTAKYMKDSADSRDTVGKIDAVGILLLAVGVGCLQVVLERGNREGWLDSTMIRWLMVFATLGLGTFVAWEFHVPFPCVNLRVLRHRGLTAATLYAVVLGFGIYGSLFILPVFLQEVRGYTAMQAGTMMITDGVASAISMAIAGRLVQRIQSRYMVAVGAVAFASSMYLMHQITLGTGPEHLFIPLVLRGSSMGLLFVPLSLAALNGLEGSESADGSGLFNLTRQWGGSAGIAFLSTLIDHRTAFHRAILVEKVNPFNQLATVRLAGYQAYLAAHGAPLALAQRQALGVMDLTVTAQATVLAFEDAFLAIAAAFIIALPLLLLLKKGVPSSGGTTPVH